MSRSDAPVKPLVGRNLSALPNVLTWSRIIAGPVLVLLFLAPAPWTGWGVLLLFVVAASTDFIDGWLARRWHATSAVGAALDPVADKVLVLAAFVVLIADGNLAGLHLFAVALIVAREFVIAGLRQMQTAAGALDVTWAAKTKTVLQLTACAVMLAARAAPVPYLNDGGLALLWAAVALSLWTGLAYLNNVRRARPSDDEGAQR